MELTDWSSGHIPDIMSLWRQSRASETLTRSELSTALAAGTVLATAEGTAAVAFTQGLGTARQRGNIRLLMVASGQQQRGLGRELLGAAEALLRARGVTTIRLAGGVPRYLWPGIDITNESALALARSAGFRVHGHAVNMALDTRFRAPAPDGVAVHPAHAVDVVRLRDFVASLWPLWLTEFDIAAAQATLVGAWAGDRPVGFIAHSTMRQGWIGPMGTDPDHQNQGIGVALLAAVCTDLAERGRDSADIAWVGPVDYFAARGAKVSRHFERFVKDVG